MKKIICLGCLMGLLMCTGCATKDVRAPCDSPKGSQPVNR